MRKSLLVSALAAVVLMAGTALADPIVLSQTFSGITYTANLNVSSGTAVLTLNGGAAFWTNNIAIKNGGTVFNLAAGSNASAGTWSFGTDYPDNNNCADTNGGKGLCAISTANVTGNNLVMTWHFTGTPTNDPWSVQFYICTTSSPVCNTGSTNYVGNFSRSGTPTTQTPEPASLALLGAGLLALGGLVRRRK